MRFSAHRICVMRPGEKILSICPLFNAISGYTWALDWRICRTI